MKTWFITGASTGFGRALATAVIAHGDQVAVTAREVSRVEDFVNDHPLQARAYPLDVTQPESIRQAIVEARRDFGRLDVVVNNAGIVRFGPLVDLDVADFRAVVDVNLVGTFVVARAAARRWIAEGRPGCVVNVTSMNGVAAGPNAGAYGASKAGVALLTSQMALEWGSSGIRVNAVAPGLIDAGMSEPIYADPVVRAARESKVPLGRLGLASDIANVVLFLASDGAAYIHGQNIVVDGGVTGSVIAHLPRPATVDSVGPST